MNVVSLFSGVGGFDLGLEQAGMKTIYQCEWDKHATNILQRHWPDVPKWGDITTLTAQEILRHGQNPDVIAWGSPCQDLSVAGKRAGLEGERSGLFHEGMRIIKELRKETNNAYPRISIWENVAGALSSNRGADFGIILDEMAQAGAMVIEWAMLDAQHFGIPQRRRRVFVIAIFDPAIATNCPNPLLPVSQSLRGDSKKSKPKRQSAASTITDSVRSDGGILGSEIVGSLNTSDAKMGTGGGNTPMIAVPLAFDTQFGSNANVTEDISPTLKSSQQSPSVAYPIQDGRDMEKHQNGFGVASDGEPSYTLDQTGAQAVAYSVREDAKANTFSATELDHANALSALRPSPQSHHAQMFIAQPMAVRRLTPLECERLMGWPDDHTRYKADGTEQADTHRYKQCGNGVASPVARWVAEHMKQATYEG